jgi:Ca2+-binding EF-hand superfamily protein
MKRLVTAVAVLGLVLALTAPAGAADEQKKKKAKKTRGADVTALFTKLDTDKDGKLSKDEFHAFKGFGKKADAAKEPKGLSGARDTWFATLDANKDGSLSKEEFGHVKQVVADNPAKRKKAAK